MFQKLLTPWLVKKDYPVAIEGERSVGQKETRIIDTLEPVMNQHRLIVDQKLINRDHETATDQEGRPDLRYSLFFQMTRLTAEKGSLSHDDRLEAVSIAVKYFINSMAKDVDVSVQRAKDKALDKDLKEFAKVARRTIGKQGYAKLSTTERFKPRKTRWFR